MFLSSYIAPQELQRMRHRERLLAGDVGTESAFDDWPDLGRFFAPYGVIQLWLRKNTWDSNAYVSLRLVAEAPTS